MATLPAAATELLPEAIAAWPPWTLDLLRAAAAVAAALALHWVLVRVLGRAARATPWSIDNELVDRLRAPTRLLLPILAVRTVMPTLAHVPQGLAELLTHLLALGLIASVGWVMIGVVSAAERAILSRHRVDVADNLEARRMHTQLRVIRRTMVFFILVVTAAAMLMTFPRVQQIGASLLASAGIAGLVIGMAARPALENLIAGLQIALTQPIRLDDVVIIDGEWGRIEEITATYVVVRIWDQRRLIVPFSKVLQEPFQNWTRTSADILGTVFLYADWTVPVDPVRRELERIVRASPLWDGRVVGLVVTDATERTVQLRALVSAADASSAWDLRCHVREQLIAFLQREYPGCLPRVRAEVHGEARAAGATSE